MLFSPRHRLLYLALLGMEATVHTPFVWLVARRWAQTGVPLAGLSLGETWALLAGTLLAALLVLELLGRAIHHQGFYRGAVAVLAVATGLGAVRMWVYPHGGSRWLTETVGALWALPARLEPPAFVLLWSLVLWWRIAVLSSRERGFFSVGLSFRLGLLLLLVEAGVLAWGDSTTTQAGLQVLALYLFWGLWAVSLARADDKAADAPGSAVALLSWGRLAQLLALIGLTVGAVYGVAVWLAPARLWAILHSLDPLWALLGWGLSWVLYGLAFALAQVVRGVAFLLAPLVQEFDLAELLARMDALFPREELAEEGAGATAPAGPYARWAWILLRLGFLGLLLAALVGGILLFLARARDEAHAIRTDEEVGPARFAPEEPLSRLRSWLERRLRAMARLGGGPGLLSPISVEHIYANLCRMARGRGHPRRPWQPPDGYLPELCRAFPGHEEALVRITQAYMQVHYGDRPLDPETLAQVRRDYDLLCQGLFSAGGGSTS